MSSNNEDRNMMKQDMIAFNSKPYKFQLSPFKVNSVTDNL